MYDMPLPLPEGSKGLSGRRLRFVAEYLIDGNATQAAIRAGYSPKTAYAQGHRLLKDAEISKAVDAANQKVLTRLQVTHERVLTEMARIAFSDLRDLLEWGPDAKTIYDATTGLPIGATSGVKLKPSHEISEDAARAISEISETAQGLKIKLHDKVCALVQLGKHLGMFRDKDTAGSAENLLRVLVEAVQRQGAPLPINNPNAGRLITTTSTTTPDAPTPASTRSEAAPQAISPLLRSGGAV